MPGAISTFAAFVGNQIKSVPPLPNYNGEGLVLAVTGANTGLGYETALHFAKTNPRNLIITCRTSQKASTAADKISTETGYPRDKILPISLDLSSFASVRSFVKEIEETSLPLHVLVQNAGVYVNEYVETVDGLDTTSQVNVLSTFLIPILLLPVFRKTVDEGKRNPRILIVSSELHAWVHIFGSPKLSDLTLSVFDDPTYTSNRYPVSKLQEVLLINELLPRLQSSPDPRDKNIVIHSANPGLCASELRRSDRSFGTRVLETLLERSGEQGARTFVYATLDEGAKGNGKYFSEMKEHEVSPFVDTDEGKKFQPELWAEFLKVIGDKFGPLPAESSFLTRA